MLLSELYRKLLFKWTVIASSMSNCFITSYSCFSISTEITKVFKHYPVPEKFGVRRKVIPVPTLFMHLFKS